MDLTPRTPIDRSIDRSNVSTQTYMFRNGYLQPVVSAVVAHPSCLLRSVPPLPLSALVTWAAIFTPRPTCIPAMTLPVTTADLALTP